MNPQNKPPLDLGGVTWMNWGADQAAPVVILNERASVHACIAWAWGEAAQIRALAFAALDSEGEYNEDLLDIIGQRAASLAAVLERQAARTRHDATTGEGA